MNIEGIDCLGIDRVLKRGSGEIIAETRHALLVRDSVSVEKNNLNSLKLQQKIGMTRSDSLIVWMWRQQ